MSFEQRKQLVLASWIAVVGIVGIILAIDKPQLWMLIAGLALVPTAIVDWLWDAPEPTLAELIAVARSRS